MTMPGFMQSAKGQGTHLIVAFFVAVFYRWCCSFCEMLVLIFRNALTARSPFVA